MGFSNSGGTFAVGFFWSFVSAFLWGTTYISGRWLMRTDAIDPVTLSLIRYAGAGGIMLAAGVFFCGKRMFALSRKDLLAISLQGMIGMAGMSVFIFFGQRYTGAVNSSMIMTSIPVMVLLGGLLFGNRIHPLQYAGMAIAAFGCLMVIHVVDRKGIHISAFNIGDLLTFASALCWTIYSLWGRGTVKKIGGYVYTAYVMLGALPPLILLEALNWNSIRLPSGPEAWSLWGVVGYIVLFPTAGAFFAWNQAQRMLPLSVLNIMQYLTPVTVLALAWPLLGEKVTLWETAGSALVIFGVALDPAFFRKKPAEN